MDVRRVYLGLGSNLGDRRDNIARAVRQIEGKVGKVVSLSSLFTTAPWGFESANTFANAALCVETGMEATGILAACQEIERGMGRTSKSRDGIYHDRVIDIDILIIEGETIDAPALTVPHPLMHLRAFVIDPMAEIAPSLLHPPTGKTMLQLRDELHGLPHQHEV